MKLVRNIILYKCTFHAMCSHQGQNWTFSLSLSLETGRVQSVTKSDQNWKKMTEEWKCKNPVKDFKARQQLLQTNFIFSLELSRRRQSTGLAVQLLSAALEVSQWRWKLLWSCPMQPVAVVCLLIYRILFTDKQGLARPTSTLPHSYLEIFSWQSF